MTSIATLENIRRHPTQIAELDQLAYARSSDGFYRSRIGLRGAAHWASKYDVVDVLGGEGEEGRGTSTGIYGHTGCVNALNWSSDGTLLASGSDDTRVCIWKVGQEIDSCHPDNAGVEQRTPMLGLGLSTVIHTGHRANIFSVKFAPLSTNILFTAAGDHEARVFDLNQASAEAQISRSSSPHRSLVREWAEYPRNSGVCVRVLKCHRGRVKRIATEGDSDAVFLTCSEDGTVRQHDLRVGHTCKRDCPPPLCSYRAQGIGLYSLSTSPIRPESFVVAGTSPYAFLHDRRMIPRTMMEQWGVPTNPTELTQCVRRFGPPQAPLVPPLAIASDDDEANPVMPRIMRRRRARHRSDEDNHVTAAKLSNCNGRDLLLTYSGGPVCLYDILADRMAHNSPSANFETSDRRQAGRAKADGHLDYNNHSETGPEPTVSTTGTAGARETLHSRLMRGSKPSPIETSTRELDANAARSPEGTTRSGIRVGNDFTTQNLSEVQGLEPAELSSASGVQPVYQPTRQTQPPAPQEANTMQQIANPTERTSAPPSSDVPAIADNAAPEHTAFEIRIGENGEVEVDAAAELDNGQRNRDRSPSPPANREGYEALLRNVEEMNDANESDSSQMDSEVEALMRGDDSSEEDASEDFSDSDDSEELGSQPAPGASNATPPSVVPLIRPYRVYKGHRNVDTVKDVNFGGSLDDLVVSGSDDGNVFIWSKATAELIGVWKGDESVVNVMQYHPKLPVMAISGIDNSVKILAPTSLQHAHTNESTPGKGNNAPMYTTRKYSRLHEKDVITSRNQDESWTSESLSMPPSYLINLLNRAAAADDAEDGDDGGNEGGRRRIPLAALMQLANEGEIDADCNIM